MTLTHDTPATAAAWTAAGLRAMPARNFRDLVTSPAVLGDPELYAILTGELLGETAAALITARDGIARQLEQRREELAARAARTDYADPRAVVALRGAEDTDASWRSKALHFQHCLAGRIAEWERRAGTTVEAAAYGQAAEENLAVLASLVRAIAGHQAACAAADLEPEPHDEALWGLLGTMVARRPGDGDVLLAELAANPAA